jgi:hypothetical protein
MFFEHVDWSVGETMTAEQIKKYWPSLLGRYGPFAPNISLGEG